MEEIRNLALEKTFYNLSYDQLFRREMDKRLIGLAKGRLTEFGAVAIDTGQFTGRSPQDKFTVAGGPACKEVWWQNNNPLSGEAFAAAYDLAVDYLFKQKLYVNDGWCGASKKNRIGVRVITPVAWQAHFAKNMFIAPAAKEAFIPDWIVMAAAPVTIPNWKELGFNSETAVIINFEKRLLVICGNWYGGEIKKGIFSVMNYLLPLKGVGSFHCSANMPRTASGPGQGSALFFGLSGTGKTTLSADPKRKLIGDDEHGWDEEGIFNLEGGCYAKVINLSQVKEPDIYGAIKRNALLENVIVDKKGKVDFTSAAKTENTRMSYPLSFIKNSLPVGVYPHPQTIVFLTCDSFGVLPPVAKLTGRQAEYWYLSGYTAKVAGTERGIIEPQATFSPCFGGPFLTLHPKRYAEILGEKINQHKSWVYLVNTGWVNGGYGVGQRMDISATRRIVDEVLSGRLEKANCRRLAPFNLLVPEKVKGVDPEILNPRRSWADKSAYDAEAKKLAGLFAANFKRFEK